MRTGNGRNGRLSSHFPGVIRGGAGTSSRPGTATCRGEDCFRVLNAIGYHGPISIEWEDASMDRLQGAPEALAYIRSHLFEPPATAFDSAFSHQD